MMEIKRLDGSVAMTIDADTLSGANLSGAYLFGADLSRANLTEANLSEAYLTEANLSGADLSRANLSGADLSGANLTRANLSGANLSGANLTGADLSGAKLPHFQIPDGELVGWKKLSRHIICLTIPREARRTASLVGRKCRAEYARVESITPEDWSEVPSKHSPECVYRVGEIVRPDSYDDDPRLECTHGIHFFLTRAEAEEWGG